MTEIAGGRWDNLLARLFPIKGRPISPAMSPELQPVVVVQPDQPELGLLRGERLFGNGAWTGSVAGQTPKVVLRNPANSGGLIRIELIWFVQAVAAGILYLRTQPLPAPPVDLTTVGSPVTLDTRQARGLATSAVPGFGIVSQEVSAAAPLGAIWLGTYSSTTPSLIYQPGVILAPNTALEIDGTVAANLGFGLIWRERAAEPSELAGV